MENNGNYHLRFRVEGLGCLVVWGRRFKGAGFSVLTRRELNQTWMLRVQGLGIRCRAQALRLQGAGFNDDIHHGLFVLACASPKP